MTEQTSQDYLTTLVTPLLDTPAELRVVSSLDPMGELLTVTVAPTDAGFVIGRSGEMIQSIRSLLRAFGYKTHRRVSLHLTNQEPNNRLHSQPNDHAPKTNYLPGV
jgi:predicted RNA-binding protein YlqC (UPF0109 family)